MINSTRIVQARLILFLKLMFFCMVIIFIRLVYLQVNLAAYFFRKSECNFKRVCKINSMRGNILDCNGKLLATNRPIIDLHWKGTGARALSRKQIRALKKLSEILSADEIKYESCAKSIMNAERGCRECIIVKDVPLEILGQIEELFAGQENIIFRTRFTRCYPYGSCASHIVGYLSDVNVAMRGRMGLERIFQDNLCGIDGALIRTINSRGKKLAEQEMKPSVIGGDIQTTIDIKLQELAENSFFSEYAGAMIVMDPLSGAIRVLVSRPSFDPALFLAPISRQVWHDLQKNNPFINRAFSATYPPGSIFKLITASVAYEQGQVEPDSLWNCKGYTEFGKRKYRCVHRSGHGQLTTVQALAKSCNVVFYELGKDLDIDCLAHYARLFGLGQKTGILFNEREGIVPDRQWKYDKLGERWWQGETLSVAIGQSFLSVTPIQIARMISSIFTEKLVRPRILLSESVENDDLEIQLGTLKFLRRSMRAVVTKGTGRRVKHLKDIEIYAKTSTAQVSGLKKGRLDDVSHLEHGWFGAYFRYKDCDPMTLVVLVEHAGSSRVPIMIAKNFFVGYKKLKDAENTSLN